MQISSPDRVSDSRAACNTNDGEFRSWQQIGSPMSPLLSNSVFGQLRANIEFFEEFANSPECPGFAEKARHRTSYYYVKPDCDLRSNFFRRRSMRGAFPPSHCRHDHEGLGRGVISAPNLVMVLFVLLVSPVGYGQSGNSSSRSMEFTSATDSLKTYHSAADDLRFSPDVGPTARENSKAPANLPDSAPSEYGVDVLPGRHVNFGSEPSNSIPQTQEGVRGTESDSSDEGVKASGLISEAKERPDRNLDIYYRNR